MSHYISKDYETGLYLLRAELEPEAEVPRITFEDPTELPDQTALTIPFEGQIEAMKKAMKEGFPRLAHYIEENNLSTTGDHFTIYHKVDMRTMRVSGDMAIPAPKETQSNRIDT
jgi:hypothetical protein